MAWTKARGNTSTVGALVGVTAPKLAVPRSWSVAVAGVETGRGPLLLLSLPLPVEELVAPSTWLLLSAGVLAGLVIDPFCILGAKGVGIVSAFCAFGTYGANGVDK